MELQKYKTAKQAYDDALKDYRKKWELCENGEISEDELFTEYIKYSNGPCKNFWEIVDEIAPEIDKMEFQICETVKNGYRVKWGLYDGEISEDELFEE